MNNSIKWELPLSKRGRFFLFLSYVFSFLILIFGVYGYLTLPEKVAVHFNLSGNPDRYGSKVELLIISLVFFVLSFLFSLLVHKRHYVLKKFPYLINIPSFYLYTQKMNNERQSYWIAQYFEFLATIMFLVNLMFLIIEYFMFVSALKGRMPHIFNYFIISYTVFLTVFAFGYLINLYKKVKNNSKEIKGTL